MVVKLYKNNINHWYFQFRGIEYLFGVDFDEFLSKFTNNSKLYIKLESKITKSPLGYIGINVYNLGWLYIDSPLISLFNKNEFHLKVFQSGLFKFGLDRPYWLTIKKIW